MSSTLAQPSTTGLNEGLEGFTNRDLNEFMVGIVGDLHLEPGPPMDLFHEGLNQVETKLRGEAEEGALPGGARIVQLGDLGGYKANPGSQECFDRARTFLDRLPVPRALVLGNHDLEGHEFETDADNLAAWQHTFGQRHYWAAELGPLVCIGLSTTRFRSSPFSIHEVHIDDEQLAWFEATLASLPPTRPVAVFTHAPPMGSGLRVLQEIHVKNRCAWLNHSSNPHVFLDIVERHPNIQLWFSGHFHLSHNYADSISVVGRCAFVQTGVMGNCHRDGCRHSRVLKGDSQGYQLYTLDHSTGQLRLDLQHGWAERGIPEPIIQEQELLACDPANGWLCSVVDCELGDGAVRAVGSPRWWAAGGDVMLARHGALVVEYDATTMAPVGLVVADAAESEEVVLVDADGLPVGADFIDDGSTAVALELRPSSSTQAQISNGNGNGNGSAGNGATSSHGGNGAAASVRRFERNELGSFYRIFQTNRWAAKQREREAESTQQNKPAVLAAA